ncbi:hypothetical protein TNCV_4548441 [Trichonephila clavipes]|nr:hypothetical protein TNCV_4548441 [Trichonephila clavipes]
MNLTCKRCVSVLLTSDCKETSKHSATEIVIEPWSNDEDNTSSQSYYTTSMRGLGASADLMCIGTFTWGSVVLPVWLGSTRTRPPPGVSSPPGQHFANANPD